MVSSRLAGLPLLPTHSDWSFSLTAALNASRSVPCSRALARAFWTLAIRSSCAVPATVKARFLASSVSASYSSFGIASRFRCHSIAAWGAVGDGVTTGP